MYNVHIVIILSTKMDYILLDVKDVFLLDCVIHFDIIYYFVIVSVLILILINITTSKTAS